MKFTVAMLTACALLFLSAEISRADELSDLKKQLEQVQQKLEDLEKKQENQSKEVKKVEELSKSVDKLKKQPSAYTVVSEALGKQVTVGGHFKFFLADQSIGERNGYDQHNSFSAGINDLWLFFNKKLSDSLQIYVAPRVEVAAAATPSLGSDISRSGSSDVSLSLDEAYLTLRLPRQFELKAGAIYPLFSEEYAKKIWWHEQYHGNNGLMTLQSMKSAGLEVYRNFDFDNFSLPVYFYLLNGEDRGLTQDKRYTDNNSVKDAMFHAAPEFFAFGSRVRLLGSFGFGRWDSEGDKDSIQWATGVDVTFRSLNLSGEYMNRWRESIPLIGGGTEDGEDKGWYIKANYAFNPQWRLTVRFSDVDLWATSTNNLLTDNYKTLSTSVGFWITDNSTIIPQIEY
ncbi:hypothetical protein ACFL0M_06690, partial [Thermodesulfobacteriota bacterium]